MLYNDYTCYNCECDVSDWTYTLGKQIQYYYSNNKFNICIYIYLFLFILVFLKIYYISSVFISCIKNLENISNKQFISQDNKILDILSMIKIFTNDINLLIIKVNKDNEDIKSLQELRIIKENMV